MQAEKMKNLSALRQFFLRVAWLRYDKERRLLLKTEILMVRNIVFARGGFPYHKERRLLLKAEILMVRNVVFARGRFPYFDERQTI